MKRTLGTRSITCLIMVLLCCLLVGSAALANPPELAASRADQTVLDQSAFATDRILVQFAEALPATASSLTSIGCPRTGVASLDALSAAVGARRIEAVFNGKEWAKSPQVYERLGMDRIYTIHLDEDADIPSVVEQYADSPFVVFAEPDYVGTCDPHAVPQSTLVSGSGLATKPNDPLFSQQWALDASPGDADIDAPEAWDVYTGDAAMIVAVLDTGINYNHEDLRDRIWSNADEIPGDGFDNDSNGYVDDVRGWDFANNDNDPMDDHWHGTNVSSIIGSTTNNGIGYAGLDWHAQLMPVKNLDENGYTYSMSIWANSVRYAVDNGADVINMSEIVSYNPSTLRIAIEYAYESGVIIVAAMGNYDNSSLQYPAVYSQTIAVGATDAQDQRASPFLWRTPGGGSNYGPHLDVVAPGDIICGPSSTDNSGYDVCACGTSQSTPYVSALAAMLLGQDRSRTFEQVRAIIRDTSEDMVGRSSEDTAGFDVYHGYGRINAHQALLVGAPTVVVPTLPPPTVPPTVPPVDYCALALPLIYR